MNFDSFFLRHYHRNVLWVQAVLSSTTTENWIKTGQLTCDCPVFMKNYYCKQTLSLAVRLHYTTFPVDGRGTKTSSKPKTVRRTLAK